MSHENRTKDVQRPSHQSATRGSQSAACRWPATLSIRVAAFTAVLALLFGLLAAAPVRAAGCTVDGQGADDLPGQKDLDQFCNLGACAGGISYSWNFDDTNWNGNNTGDACALYDTDNDGFANRAVCATIVAGPALQAGNPKCYTCNDDAPDRCNGSVLVACTSTCSLTAQVTDPFTGFPNHNTSKCNGTNCDTKDTLTGCCVKTGDAGGGQLIDTCSYPSQQPNSAPSDCIVNPPSCATDADCDDGNPCSVDTCSQVLGDCVHVAGNQGAQCRQAAGVCDVPEVCNGTSRDCPDDQLETAGTLCRGATDLCDNAETCTGSSADCPADGVKPSGTSCRAANGQCDVAEVCNGSSKACPADQFKPNNTGCSDDDACTSGDVCVGGVCTPGGGLNCNDGNGCTDDSCDPGSGCKHVNNNAACSDGNACTSGDACSGGACVGGPAVSCNDNNVCTDDSCNPATGCVNANNTAPCSDGNECTTPDICGSGACASGGPLNCNDNNACTTDSCDAALGCQHDFLPNCQPCTTGADCQNGTVCDGVEQCVAGKCQSGVSPNCDDTNGCTDDGCDAVTGCTHLDNNDPCDDGNACTTADACSGGSCAGGPPPDCNNNNVCTTDSCNPASGCVHTNNTNPCSDDSECTTGDTCSGGSCVGGPAPDCDDGNACTADSCDPGTGCVHTNTTDPCSDGNGCTENDVCSGGLCQPGSPKDCSDGNGCTDDSCSAPSGTCLNIDNVAPCDDLDNCSLNDACSGGSCQPGTPKDCDDQNGCTTDSCDAPIGACINDPNTNPCDDGSACTDGDVCGGGTCAGSTIDCDDDNVCTDDGCNIETGCTYVNNNDPCTDGSACTTADTCSGGNCVGGPAPNCNDNNVCTDDGCNPLTGCFNNPNGQPCTDDNACTTGDVCAGGSCQPGGPTDCDDDNACTTDSCVAPGGCQHDPVANCCNVDGECTDTDLCTQNNRCVAHECVSDPVNCNDSNGCTDDGCAPATGCTHVNTNDPCNDNNACTTADACSNGGCVGGPPPNCITNNVCLTDSCNPASGCVHTNNTNPCSDGSECTTGDQCHNGSCQGGPAPTCNDFNVCTNDSCDPGTSGGCVFTNNTEPCSDGNACTVSDTCTNGSCVAQPRDCADTDPCSVDVCDNQGGDFLCVHNNCCSLDGQPCPPNPQCICAGCGNGVVEAGLGETCDPPDATLIPGTELSDKPQPKCRPDCTFCGDATVQASEGLQSEACDDGNQVTGCDPVHPQKALDACQINCTQAQCQDPAKILLQPGLDRLDLHTRLTTEAQLDFRNRDFIVEITDRVGVVLYRVSLEAGTIAGDPAIGKFKYKNKYAKTTGGLARFKTTRHDGSYRITLQSYGDLSWSQAAMGTNIYLQDMNSTDEWTLIAGDWEPTKKGWRFTGR